MGAVDTLDGCPKGTAAGPTGCECIPGATPPYFRCETPAQGGCPPGQHRANDPRDYGYDPNKVVCQLNCDSSLGEKIQPDGTCRLEKTLTQTQQNPPYQYQTLNNDLGMLFGFALIGSLIFLFIRYRKKSEETTLAASPEHPFKVNVVVEPMQGNAAINVIRGRKLTHILKMDVKISLKDWKRIKDAGLYDAVLFDYANTTSTYSGDRQTCHVRELQNPTGVSFYNIGEAEHAKEQLIEKLYDLRSAIDAHRAPPQAERLEI